MVAPLARIVKLPSSLYPFPFRIVIWAPTVQHDCKQRVGKFIGQPLKRFQLGHARYCLAASTNPAAAAVSLLKAYFDQ